MKKLLWSAFALSLMLPLSPSWAQTEGVDDFLGLESEILPDLQGEQRFTSEDLHENESWQVSTDKVVIDLPEPNKGQGHSIIPWKTLDPEEWLSIDTWLSERKIKDETPDWKIRLRRAAQNEKVGKVLHCFGECFVHRGTLKAAVTHLSRLEEGDELSTEKNSVAWVFTMDGGLMRLSPETSVSFNEIDIGNSEFFLLSRLNQGHIYWHPRNPEEMKVDLAPETDSVSLPLMVREANVQNFERKIFQAGSSINRVNEVMELDEKAIRDQFKLINELKQKNNSKLSFETRFMLVTPNGSIVSKGVSFDSLYVPGGNGYLKMRSDKEGAELSVHLRGYKDSEVKTITSSLWHQIISNGRSLLPLTDASGILQVTDLLTKRIKTMELAREIWAQKYTVPLMEKVANPKELARDYGYTKWGDELNRRYDFLVEYTRRIETTNLRSLENLLVKLENSGEKINREISESHYQVSLNHYLLGLKSRYDNKQMKVREMTDLQYYVWILRNGK